MFAQPFDFERLDSGKKIQSWLGEPIRLWEACRTPIRINADHGSSPSPQNELYSKKKFLGSVKPNHQKKSEAENTRMENLQMGPMTCPDVEPEVHRRDKCANLKRT